jgi:hypothetical protein
MKRQLQLIMALSAISFNCSASTAQSLEMKQLLLDVADNAACYVELCVSRDNDKVKSENLMMVRHLIDDIKTSVSLVAREHDLQEKGLELSGIVRYLAVQTKNDFHTPYDITRHIAFPAEMPKIDLDHLTKNMRGDLHKLLAEMQEAKSKSTASASQMLAKIPVKGILKRWPYAALVLFWIHTLTDDQAAKINSPWMHKIRNWMGHAKTRVDSKKKKYDMESGVVTDFFAMFGNVVSLDKEPLAKIALPYYLLPQLNEDAHIIYEWLAHMFAEKKANGVPCIAEKMISFDERMTLLKQLCHENGVIADGSVLESCAAASSSMTDQAITTAFEQFAQSCHAATKPVSMRAFSLRLQEQSDKNVRMSDEQYLAASIVGEMIMHVLEDSHDQIVSVKLSAAHPFEMMGAGEARTLRSEELACKYACARLIAQEIMCGNISYDSLVAQRTASFEAAWMIISRGMPRDMVSAAQRDELTDRAWGYVHETMNEVREKLSAHKEELSRCVKLLMERKAVPATELTITL